MCLTQCKLGHQGLLIPSQPATTRAACTAVLSVPTVRNMSLKERFERFMLSTPGVESIDNLMRQHDRELAGRKRADYLACDRRVVIETKSVDVDPVKKIQEFLDRLAQAGHLTKAGNTTLAELLSGLPNGQALFNELQGRVTKVLDDNVARADDQARDTKDIFNIPE